MKTNRIIFIVIVCLILLFCLFSKTKEHFFFNIDKKQLFEDLMENHYKNIFPNNQNRNSAGFRFFKYIYDNLATSEELFDVYNQFYCAVSGSIVSPGENNYNVLKVKDRSGKCVFGKYYRCCTPCNCDIMKFATVIPTQIEMPKNSKKFVTKMLLTINDPCVNKDSLPNELDVNVFQCNQQNLLEKGYRVNDNNKLTTGPGRLVIGVLYPVQESEKNQVETSLKMCEQRISMKADDLQYGMGDIFVKLAKLNDNTKYQNNQTDLCS